MSLVAPARLQESKLHSVAAPEAASHARFPVDTAGPVRIQLVPVSQALELPPEALTSVTAFSGVREQN
jgi:hypothetical protein